MKEFICMAETPADTQKKIRQWMSTGYEVELLAQSSHYVPGEGLIVVTSLIRTDMKAIKEFARNVQAKASLGASS
jgi:hypothetical protein